MAELLAPANVPDWLKLRQGELKPSKYGSTWTVYFAGEPLYLLEPVPAQGKFACRVSMTNNGKRLDRGGVWASRAEAIKGGLEDLREAMGW
jgi:hypothetical protein